MPVILLFGFVLTSCEKEENEEIETFKPVNTLDNSSVGNGMTGHTDNYFFPLDVMSLMFSSISLTVRQLDLHMSNI